MKADHKKWADLVIKGINPKEAILQVWPNVTEKTARNKACVLGQRQDLSDYIKARSEKITEKVDNMLAEELKEVQLGEIMSANQKRVILAKIIAGTLEVEKVVIVKGEPKKIKCKPDASDIMRAIEVDNKMSGDNVQAKPNQVAKAQEVEKIIVVEDETEPGSGHND